MRDTIKKTLIMTSIFGLINVHASFEGCRLPDPLPEQVCQLIKSKETIIFNKKKNLQSLREIQGLILQGKRIQTKLENGQTGELSEDELLINELALIIENDEQAVEPANRLNGRLMDPENSFELIKVEEQINDEIGHINDSDNTQLRRGIGSIGGLIISSITISVMNKSTKGQAFKRRLMAQLFPSEKKIMRWTLNAALIVSLALGFFAAFKMFENYKEKVTLKKMIEILSTIKDQADNMATLKEELDELESCYWLQVDQLLDSDLAKESPTGLQCL
jgi:hypothetical protein